MSGLQVPERLTVIEEVLRYHRPLRASSLDTRPERAGRVLVDRRGADRNQPEGQVNTCPEKCIGIFGYHQYYREDVQSHCSKPNLVFHSNIYEKKRIFLQISPEERDHPDVGILCKVLMVEAAVYNHETVGFSLVDLKLKVLVSSVKLHCVVIDALDRACPVS